MKNDKIVRAYDAVQPSEAQKEQMLQAILSQTAAPATKAKRRRPIGRVLLIAAVLLAAAITALAGRSMKKWSLPAPTTYEPAADGSIYDVHETAQYPDTTQPEDTTNPAGAAENPSETVSAAPTNEALIQSAKDILSAAGLNAVDTSAAEVTRQENLHYDREEAEVFFTQNTPPVSVKFSAATGALLSLSCFDDQRDTSAAPVCATDADAEALARRCYEALPVTQGYVLAASSKFDDEYWSYDFSRLVADGLYNPYETVRITINRLTGCLTLCNVFDFPLLDDHESGEEMLTQAEAADAAIRCGAVLDGSVPTGAELGCVLPNWFGTDDTWSGNVQAAKVSRLAWTLTYEDTSGTCTTATVVYIDAYTGEHLGGDGF